MEFLDQLPDWVKWIGGIGGTLAGASLFLRQYLSAAATVRASDSAQIEALDVYKTMVDGLREALVIANKRSDDFARERNEAISLAGELKGQIAAMTAQVDGLRREVGQLRDELNAKNKI